MHIAQKTAESLNFYYGWVIVGVAVLSMSFWFGIRSSFSVFYVALLEEFPWNRAESAGVQSLVMICYSVTAPLAGMLIDRFGPRRVIVPGIFILTLGLTLTSAMQHLAHFYMFYGLIVGVGSTAIGIVSYSAIMAHWFEKKRGLASGIAVSGMGLGIFLLVPFCQEMINVWGWRLTFLSLGVLSLLFLWPANGLLLLHKPQDILQQVDGNDFKTNFPDDISRQNGRLNPDVALTLKQILSSARFWFLMTFPFLCIMAVYIILVHSMKFMVDQGIDKMTASFLFALLGATSCVFRIFWGWLSDHLGRERSYTLGMLFACAGVAALLILEMTHRLGFAVVFSLLFGIGWGVAAPMIMSSAADLFKGRFFGLICGTVEGGIGVGGAFGAWIGGWFFDKTQSYRLAFFLAIAVLMVSCIFIWLAAPGKNRIGLKHQTASANAHGGSNDN